MSSGRAVQPVTCAVDASAAFIGLLIQSLRCATTIWCCRGNRHDHRGVTGCPPCQLSYLATQQPGGGRNGKDSFSNRPDPKTLGWASRCIYRPTSHEVEKNPSRNSLVAAELAGWLSRRGLYSWESGSKSDSLPIT
eukprot:2574185-Pyramimonas_sp.AAC.1